MKILSVVVPCYNSQDYIERCIDSLLIIGSGDVEIIIVNDGSTDNTALISNRYAEKYPQMVSVIHQENGGHGAAINTGIEYATGIFFKVVDSDDWIDPAGYFKIMGKLREFVHNKSNVDMVVSNFVYENEFVRKKKIMSYERLLPENKIFNWDDTRNFPKGKYLLMHSVIFSTKILKESNLVLPKHTFYVDNLFVFIPLIHVRRIFYLNEVFYRYYIGREDQSVNEKNMIGRIEQQLKVNTLMIESINRESIPSRKLQKYLLHYIEIITIISTIMLYKSNSTNNLERKRELWQDIKKINPWVHRKLRLRIMVQIVNLPWKLGYYISILGYNISKKRFGFN